MHRALLLAVLMTLGLPTLANATGDAAVFVQSVGSAGADDTVASLQLNAGDSELASLRRIRSGRAMVGFAVGMQGFQVIFAILARALADPLGPWAPGDSLAVEGIVALASIPAVPVGIAGFKRLAANPRRGTAIGLLEGGIYACSYAGLHLLFSGISEALPSGGQGNALGFVIFGLPLMISHFTLGATLTVIGAVLLNKSRSQQARLGSRASVEQRHSRATPPLPILSPAPLVYRDGGGLALVAVF